MPLEHLAHFRYYATIQPLLLLSPTGVLFFIKAVSDAAQSRTQDTGAAKIMWPTIKIKHLMGAQQG